jgi:hypothetical protein
MTPYHSLPYDTIPLETTPYNVIQYHTIPNQIHRFDNYVIWPGSLALMNHEPITLCNLLIRARFQARALGPIQFDNDSILSK